MRVIMLSPPGAGKGTQCALLAAATGVRHVSSGDVLRAEIAAGTELGQELERYAARGDLVPDDLVLEILLPVVQAADRETDGYLLDGFPRTEAQASRAAELGLELGLSTDTVVHLTAPTDVLTARLLRRAELEGRADDNPEVIRHRLDVFETQTRPLLDYYRGRGILLEVDADRPVDDVQADLRRQLGVKTT